MFRHAGILALSVLIALGSGCAAAPQAAVTARNTLSPSTASALTSAPAVPSSNTINPISAAASPSVTGSAAKPATQVSPPFLPTLPVVVPSSAPPVAPISAADSERPIITFVSIPDNAVVQGSAAVIVRVRDNTALSRVVVNFKKNGVPVTGGNHIVYVSDKSAEVRVTLPAGLAQYTAYTVSIGARDKANNTASTVTRVFTVDNTRPSTSYSSPAHGQSVNNDAKVVIDYNDDVLVASAHVSVVGQNFDKTYNNINGKQGSFEIPVKDLELSDGAYTIRTVLTDTAGNESVTSDRYFVVDNTAPSAPAKLSPDNNGYTNDPKYLNSWQPVDGAVSYEYESSGSAANLISDSPDLDDLYADSVNAGGWGVHNKGYGGWLNQDQDWRYTIGASLVTRKNWYPDEGGFYWRVRAIDAAGNVGPWSEPSHLTVDYTAPVVGITSLNDGDVIKGTVPLSITATDQNMAAYSYRIRKVNADGSNTADAPIVEQPPLSTPGVNNQLVFSWDTTKLGNGKYYVYASGRDAAGNRAEKRIFVTVDSTKPTVTLKLPASSVIKSGTPIVLWAVDNNALNRVVANIYKAGTTGVYKATQLGASGAATLTDTVSTVGLPEGQYYVKFNATDLADNLSATTTYNFTVDNTAPTITVKPESKGLNGVFSEVSFKLFDAHQVDRAVINDVVKDLTDNTWSDVNYVRPGVFGGKEGQNTITVYDVAGNTATYDFVLDTTGPEITVKSGSTDSVVSFKLHDTGSAVDKVAINGVVKDLTDNAWSDVNGVKPGTFNAIQGLNILTAYDVLGNTSTYSFTLD